jgi:hypothetical protein
MLGLAGCGAAMAADNVSQPAGPASLAAAASWRIVKTVKGTSSLSPSFTAIAATSAHDAWAFESTSAKPVAWRLTGSAWRRVAFPGRSGDTITAAGASSPGNVWAFTSDFGGFSRAIAWNGARWTVVRRFRQAAIEGALVLGRRDVWAFGGGTWHFDGTSWTRYPSVPTLTAASALGAASIWAVGGTVAAHWNGRAWSKMSLARVLPRPSLLCPGPSADGVYAQSPRNVWVVGAANCLDDGGPFVMLHYDGKQWRRVALLPSYGEPAALVPDGFGGLWIATIVVFPGFFTMLHYTGGHLRAATMPLPSSQMRVNALAHVPHTAVTFGAGVSSSAFNPGVNPSAIIVRYGA